MKLFSYDGPLNQFVMKAVDCFFISLLWLVTSIPVVTMGASAVALYHTVDKVICKDEGGIWKTYWKAFLRDFWQATGIWLMLFLFYGTSLAAVSAIRGMGMGAVASGFLIAAVLVVTLWTQYWFPYLSRFEDKTKTILRNTLVMLLVDFFRSVKLLLLLVLCVALGAIGLLYAPIFVIMLPAVYVLLGNRTVDKVFARYLPMPEEEREEPEEECSDLDME